MADRVLSERKIFIVIIIIQIFSAISKLLSLNLKRVSSTITKIFCSVFKHPHVYKL